AVNAVAARLGADIDDRIPRLPCSRVEDAVSRCEADAHGIHENVVVVALVEIRLAADGRNADAIAVIADAGHHSGHEMAHARMIGRAEAQRVHHGDWPGTHREHVAHDAADARRRSLIGLDVGRVIVALHLEDYRLTVPDIDNARILARTLDDLRAVRGEPL